MSIALPYGGSALVNVPNGARIAVFSLAPYSVSLITRPTDLNGTEVLLFNGAGVYTSPTYANGATIAINGGGDSDLFYSVGTAATVVDTLLTIQPTPGVLNATGTLTSALIQSGIVTSTTAAAVTATLDTGAVMELSGSFAVNDCFFWSVINTGGTNAFTVTPAASGHTVVGNGAVAANSSGRFMTRKTATDTFVTYRI